MKICHCTLPHLHGVDVCKGCQNNEPAELTHTNNEWFIMDDNKIRIPKERINIPAPNEFRMKVSHGTLESIDED